MSQLIEVKVPDIGDFKNVEIIEVLVKPGDSVKKEDSLISLESDKATMEVPSSHSGVVKELKIKVGDKVSEGSIVLTLEEAAGAAAPAPSPASSVSPPAVAAAPTALAPRPLPVAPAPVSAPAPAPTLSKNENSGQMPHASPAIRAFSRELGVDLAKVKGTALKGRITREDVQGFVKAELARPKGAAAGAAFSFPEMPPVDFTKFGQIRRSPAPQMPPAETPVLPVPAPSSWTARRRPDRKSVV